MQAETPRTPLTGTIGGEPTFDHWHAWACAFEQCGIDAPKHRGDPERRQGADLRRITEPQMLGLAMANTLPDVLDWDMHADEVAAEYNRLAATEDAAGLAAGREAEPTDDEHMAWHEQHPGIPCEWYERRRATPRPR